MDSKGLQVAPKESLELQKFFHEKLRLVYTRINGPFGAYMGDRFAAGFVTCFVLCLGALNLATSTFPYLT